LDVYLNPASPVLCIRGPLIINGSGAFFARDLLAGVAFVNVLAPDGDSNSARHPLKERGIRKAGNF